MSPASPDQDAARARLAERVLAVYPRGERVPRDMLARIGDRLPHPVSRGADDHLVRNVFHTQDLLLRACRTSLGHCTCITQAQL
jgi:hypothetical protein